MIRTTKLKNVQAPSMRTYDLTPQVDGVKQTFDLPVKVYSQDQHYLVWNGQVYRNDRNHTFYFVSSDGMQITTTFNMPPIPGDDKALQFVKTENAEGDGEYATTDYVNSRVSEVAYNLNSEAATRATADENLQTQVTANANAISDETLARATADTGLQTQIDAIVAGSDVKDIVGTYADLQAYDTSKLGDNDIIKVLQDETRQYATTYYRWSTASSAFSFIGEEGPYYTKSATDTLLLAKQDNLIAGTNIQIAADGKTISATDTTYTHFTGATASADGTQGLVPGPLAGDQNKVLKGDGTWGDVKGTTTFYVRELSSNTGNIVFYKDFALTTTYTLKEVEDAMEFGPTEIRVATRTSGTYIVDNVFNPTNTYIQREASDPTKYFIFRIYLRGDDSGSNDYKKIVMLNAPQYSLESATATFNPGTFTLVTDIDYATTTKYGIVKIGDNLTTDSNYKLIAKTMTGASAGAAGTVGVVPAPAAGDEDKVLKGDGTWGTISTVEYYTTQEMQEIWEES